MCEADTTQLENVYPNLPKHNVSTFQNFKISRRSWNTNEDIRTRVHMLVLDRWGCVRRVQLVEFSGIIDMHVKNLKSCEVYVHRLSIEQSRND